MISDYLSSVLTNTTALDIALAQWEQSGTGPLTTHLNTHLCFNRFSPDSPAVRSFGDPSAGRNTPHIEMVISVRHSFS